MKTNSAIFASVFMALSAAVVFGATVTNKDLSQMTSEEKAKWLAARQAEHYRKTGGRIVKPGSRHGSVALMFEKGTLPEAEIKKVAQILENDNNVTYVLRQIETGTKPERAMADANATFAVFVVKNEDSPSTLVATDEHWAIVNVEKFRKGIPDGPLSYVPYYSRCRKGILRAYAILVGGGRSQFPNNILAISTLEDLDAVEEFIPGDAQLLIRQNLKSSGVTPETTVTYIKACKEGWAPAPTNDVQKAIWEQIKADKERGPTNPIEIPRPNKRNVK